MVDDDDLARQLAVLFPTWERVESLGERRQQEYDVVVSVGKELARPPHYGAFEKEPDSSLFVIGIGVQELGRFERPANSPMASGHWLGYRHTSIASEYEVPYLDRPDLQRLIETDLVPAVRARTGGHHVLGSHLGAVSDDDGVVPLLKTTEGAMLAALFLRVGRQTWGLALPGDIRDPVGWVKAALRLFRESAPDRFQQIPGWEEREEWLTAEEASLSRELGDLEAERRRVLHSLQSRETTLRAELAAASARADAGLRLLLTAQSEGLVEAVAGALNTLGFEAKGMDPEHDPSNKLEDIRVNDPQSEDSWEALVEVRGYRRGASLGDLLRTQRFAANFERVTGRPPAAVWYIVNQLAGQDPAQRMPVLSSQQSDLEEWAEMHGGVAIDTATLFRLVSDVEAGRLAAREARAMLRQASVRFTYPPS